MNICNLNAQLTRPCLICNLNKTDSKRPINEYLLRSLHNVKAAILMNLSWIIGICIYSSREMLIVLTELMNAPSLVLNNREFKNPKP